MTNRNEVITACMGGWCPSTRRDRCRHHLEHWRLIVVERLCEPGSDDAFERVGLLRVVHRALPAAGAMTHAR